MERTAPRLTTRGSFSATGLGPSSTGGGGRTALLLPLALLYPWHLAIWVKSYTGKNPPIPHGGLNLSLGDGIVAVIGVIMLFQLAAGRVRLPRYALQTVVWFAVAVGSVTVNALSPSFFFSLHDSEVGLGKILGAAAWMIAVFWLLQDSFPRRFLQLAGTSVLAASGFAIQSIIENVFLGVQRSFGPFENANIYGNYLMLNAFLAIGVDRFLGAAPEGVTLRPAARNVIRPLLRFGAVTLLILGLLASGSRGAMVGFAAGLVAAIPRGALKRVSVRGALAAVAGALVLGSALGWDLQQNPFVVQRWSQTAESQGPNVPERFA